MIKKKIEESRPLPADVVMLDDLIKACYKQLVDKMAKDAKLGDFLKMVEMRAKMFRSESEQAEFWKMLDKVRAETLAGNGSKKQTAPSPKKSKIVRKGK